MPGAIVVGGFTPYPPHPFLVLIQEKGAKENQAPTGGGEAGRVLNGAIEMVSIEGGRRVGAVVGRQGRGELHSPQHVPRRDRGARRLVAGKWVSIGGGRSAVAGKWVSIEGEWVTPAGKINSIGGEWVTPAGKIISVGNIGRKVAPEWVSNGEIDMIYTQNVR